MHVEAWSRRERIRDRVKVTEACFTYVALGEDGSRLYALTRDKIFYTPW